MRHFILGLAALAAAGGAVPSAAKEPAAEQPAEPQDDPAKFFVFHLDGVAFETARADYGYCIGQSWRILSLRDKTPSQGGLLGALINGRMAEIDRFRMRNAAMRKCMGLMGYARYAMPESEWKILVKQGDIVVADNNKVDPEVVERLARLASGPTPATERLDP